MQYFDKNNILIRLGCTIINNNGVSRKVIIALDGETIGIQPLDYKNWDITCGVLSLERLNLSEWRVDLSDYITEFYHVTLAKNLDSILTNGLIPRIGERSLEIGEKEASVYIFPSEADMECAVMQWLGDWYEDEYGEDVELVCLEINVPYNFPIENGEVEYEYVSKDIIPNKYIKFFKYVN